MVSRCPTCLTLVSYQNRHQLNPTIAHTLKVMFTASSLAREDHKLSYCMSRPSFTEYIRRKMPTRLDNALTQNTAIISVLLMYECLKNTLGRDGSDTYLKREKRRFFTGLFGSSSSGSVE